MNPLISVIIPVYQVAPYIKRCIESVINQTYQNLEIILVDDGSTDGSGELCDRYAKRDNRIKAVHQENKGLSEARNRGLDIAEGDYLGFIDSDDWVDLKFIEAMYEAAVSYNCEIVQCGHIEVVADEEYESDTIGKAVIYSKEEYSKAAYTLLGWKCSVAWNKLYKKQLFSGIRYPVGKLHEDEFTTYKVIWNARKIAVLNTRLYFYRQRKDSIMGRAYSARRLDAREAYKERAEFYKSRNCDVLSEMVYRELLSWDRYYLPFIKTLKGNYTDIIEIMEKEKQSLEERFCNDKKRSGMKSHGYLFPFMDIPRGSDIILYGAGNVGCMYYRQILVSNYCNVILWVDRNFKEYREKGLIVSAVKEIEKHRGECDFLVIAIKDYFLALEIKSEIIRQFRIKPEKIKHEIMEI